MIKGIILHNFQSHSHTEINFSKGINSITGQSNNGKTAIMRGFEDCRNNASTGLDDVSHWAKKQGKKGNYLLKDDSYTTVIFWDDICITRKRGYSPAFNGYIINYPDGREEIFDKIGRTNVPTEIQRIFNMAEVNLQNQYDSAFLVSKNGQEVARFFNRLVKLDDADKAMTTAKSRRNKSRSEVKLLELEITSLETKVAELSWTENALMQTEKLMVLEQDILKKEKLCDEIGEVIDDIGYHEIRIQNTSYTDSVSDLLSNLKDLDEFIEDKENYLQKLEDLIYTLEKVQCNVAAVAWIDNAFAEMFKLEKIDNDIFESCELAENIEAMIHNIEATEIAVKLSKGKADKYSKMLPEKCPTCKQLWRREK